MDTSLQVQSLSSELKIEQISVFSPETGALTPWEVGEKSWPLFFETQSYELVVEKKQTGSNLSS